VRLDFGESAFSRRPVTLDIIQRLPATLTLIFCSLAISGAGRRAFGSRAALNHNQWPDYLLRVFSVLGIAVAAFWFAIMLQLLFAMDLGWLPLRGDLTSTMAPARSASQASWCRSPVRRPLGRLRRLAAATWC